MEKASLSTNIVNDLSDADAKKNVDHNQSDQLRKRSGIKCWLI